MRLEKIYFLRQILTSPNITSVYWNIPQRGLTKLNNALRKIGLPEKPKRPLTGYFNYLQSERVQLIAQNPNMSQKDLIILLAKQWKNLPEHEKQNYAKDYESKMKEYKKKMENFNKSLSEETKQEIREFMEEEEIRKSRLLFQRKLKEQEEKFNKPKHPGSVLAFYKKKINSPFKSFAESADIWKKLPQREKEAYKVEYGKEWEKYLDSLLKWEEEMLKMGNIDLVRFESFRKKLYSYF